VGFSNSTKTHTIANQYHYRFPTIHSELDAILNFQRPNKYLHYCTMLNVRFLKNGKLSLSKPCRGCQELLRTFGISSVVYSTNEGKFEWLT